MEKEQLLMRADRCIVSAARCDDRILASTWISLAQHYEKLAGRIAMENRREPTFRERRSLMNHARSRQA
jgi:hypothetical protein